MQLPAFGGLVPHLFNGGIMKAIIIAITLIATVAQAQTTRCVRHADGSIICTTVRSSGF